LGLIYDFREKDFQEEICKIENLQGESKRCLDIVLDSVGGSQFKKDLELLRPGGRMVRGREGREERERRGEEGRGWEERRRSGNVRGSRTLFDQCLGFFFEARVG
jgi:hypothetical protein